MEIMKEAVRQILSNEEIRKKFNEIANEVENKLKEVSNRTLVKLREMNPEVADSLNPVIPQAESLKWVDVFKSVSISSDENIPFNKRGSGINDLFYLIFLELRQKEDSRKKMFLILYMELKSQKPLNIQNIKEC